MADKQAQQKDSAATITDLEAQIKALKEDVKELKIANEK
jgi:cell division protein FtsB